MDKPSNILLEEYFDQATSEERKNEIRKEILNLKPDDPNRIMFELGDEVAMEDKVQELSSTIESIGNNRSSNWTLKIAASIVFILGSVFIGIELTKPEASNDDLFNTYFLPYDGVVVSRDNSELGFDGLHAYNAKEYQEAIEIFQNEFEETSNPEIALLISSCYLGIGNPEQALNWLNQIPDNVDRKLIYNRDWYNALALLKMEQIVEGVSLLQKIIEMKSPYSKRATKLLSDLDSR